MPLSQTFGVGCMNLFFYSAMLRAFFSVKIEAWNIPRGKKKIFESHVEGHRILDL